eukprot:952705-Ditylum_brightwellii.AAC.1
MKTGARKAKNRTAILALRECERAVAGDNNGGNALLGNAMDVLPSFDNVDSIDENDYRFPSDWRKNAGERA